jgi:peptide subunit release factor 1 (eRF1)
MPRFLDEIEKLSPQNSISIYIPPTLSAEEIEALMNNGGVKAIPDDLDQLISGAKNGVVLFWGDIRKCLVLPPFPISEKVIFNGYITEPLRQLVTNDYIIGLVLLHLGSFAIGIYQGEKLISSKVGTGLIHGRHKKGGSSQQRFQRHRENQIQQFLDRVCAYIQNHMKHLLQQIDYVVYGGPYQTRLLLQKRCPFLKSLEDRVISTIEVPLIRQIVLETIIHHILSSSIIDWQEE